MRRRTAEFNTLATLFACSASLSMMWVIAMFVYDNTRDLFHNLWPASLVVVFVSISVASFCYMLADIQEEVIEKDEKTVEEASQRLSRIKRGIEAVGTESDPES